MKTIAIDIDDTLNDLMKEWFCDFMGTDKNYESYVIQNPPLINLGITEKQYFESLDDFRCSDEYQNFVPDPKVFSWFEAHGHKAHWIALTSPPLLTAHLSAKWVIEYFGKWIRGFQFIPSSRNYLSNIPVYDKTKADYLKRMNVDFYIDDNPESVDQALEKGIKSFNVGQPWNDSKWTTLGILEYIRGIL